MTACVVSALRGGNNRDDYVRSSEVRRDGVRDCRVVALFEGFEPRDHVIDLVVDL